MKITRRFTEAGRDVFSSVAWDRRSSRISGADGSVVFEMKDAEVPASWSQLATDIVVSKYFRKAGVPQVAADGKPLRDGKGNPVLGPERSVRQVVHRLVACWKQWGQKHGYFESKRDGEAFYDELCWMLLNQVAAPNSPQWFNTGLNTAYGTTGPAQGHWIADPATGAASLASDAYTHPQPHACFIQPVRDDLVNEGGIMDLWVREARLFKYGSGTGTNFSSLRGEDEPLSGGGRSSGLMSFLKIGDRAASAIKSGGTTRRAAKMVCLDIDHPDVQPFIRWKVREELKVAALVEGMKHLPEEHRALAESMGLHLDYDFNGEAYYTVSGQNSNNSVRLTDAYLQAVEQDADWSLVRRSDGKPAKTLKARALWDEVCFAAWRCADPGVQFDTTINQWHTCPRSGRINASNPCSEYMFLDNTACNLASLNLIKFYDPVARTFDVEGYEHAIRLWTIVLEISVLMAAFPSREIAELSWRYRTLGLGYANLGAMLMQAGIPYDSEEGRAVCGALTSILTGRAYAASAEMAKELGPFAGFDDNREEMLRVIRNHRRAARGVSRAAESWEGLNIPPVSIDHTLFAPRAGGLPCRINIANAPALLAHATGAWDDALRIGEKHGYRNAQTTVIAPTGTIGLLMDCDTTGVEPDFALTKFKKLAGGGYFKIVNQSLPAALKALGYSAGQIDDIHRHVMGALSVDVPMPERDGSLPGGGEPRATFRHFLESKGYSPEQVVAVENDLPKVFDLRFAFSAWSLPESLLASVGLTRELATANRSFNGLRVLGLTKAQIDTLNRLVCGTQTVEGAPHLRDEHLPVFDCANKCGPLGQRFIAPQGHIRMMAASQPFISGAISKTINLPNDADVAEIAECYLLSWRLGLKANALYRDGCKLSQPLNTKADADAEGDVEDEESVEAALGEVAGGVAALADAISTYETSSPFVAADRRTEAVGGPAHSDAGSPPSLAALEPLIAERIRAGVEAHVQAQVEARVQAQVEARVQAEVRAAVAAVENRPLRRRLPETRHSLTHRFNVAGHEGYLTVGLYPDSAPGEVFITMAKEGSTIGGLMDSLGTATSVALQYGVPLESLVKKFAYQRFEPMGITGNLDIPFAASLVDYIFRWLGMQFIPGFREEHAPRRDAAPELDARLVAETTQSGGGTDAADRSLSSPREDPEWTNRLSDNAQTDWSAVARSRSGVAQPDTDAGSARGWTGGATDATGESHAPSRGPGASSSARPATLDAPDRLGTGAGRSHAAPMTGLGAFVPRSGAPLDPAKIVASPSTARSDSSAAHGPVGETIIASSVATRATIGSDGTVVTTRVREVTVEAMAANAHNSQLMGDAPACSNCGHITVRSGACYKCTNCGAQNGCG